MVPLEGESLNAHLAPQPRDASAANPSKACRRLARSHYENFHVGSFLLPRAVRPHFYNLYAYCRGVDDLGDEAPGDRERLLDEWQQGLERAVRGEPSGHPILDALGATLAVHPLPVDQLHRLIEANRRDQRIHRYPTHAALLRYCSYSATPVGRLVLALFGYRDRERIGYADQTCIGLQLANFWQDLRRDRAQGRIYIPLESLAAAGVREEDLDAPQARPELRRCLAAEVARAEEYFRAGWPLAATLPGRLRLDVALFSLGGWQILQEIRRQSFDVLRRRPTVGALAKGRLLLRALLWLGGGPPPRGLAAGARERA